MDPAPEKLSYNVPEAAAAIGVSKTTIYKMVNEGDLKTFKWAGRTLIRRDVLQAAIDRASMPPDAGREY